jgi:putative ABC transport system permease protein
MKLRYTLSTAIKGLKAHKSRSVLTILGIVIGIAAIILVMSIGQGAQSLILNQIQGIGSRTISIEPGREPKGPSDIYAVFTDSLKDRELKALENRANVRGNNKFAPMVIYSGVVAYENETKRANVIGSTDLWLEILGVYPTMGTMFGQDEVSQRAPVIVLGSEIKQDLFGDSDAIGKKVKVKNVSFRVIGTFPPRGQVAMFDVDKMVMVPYSTAQKYLMGINYFNAIEVQAESEAIVPQAVEDIRATLRELHNITDPEKDDFHVMTMADAVQRVGIITDVLTLLLVSVAAISLVVGGIGIMNIMLVSVTERTREIGLRKALGATGNDIMRQFLLEAVLLTMLGGGIGILSGGGLGWLVAFGFRNIGGLNWDFIFPVSAAIMGLVVAAVVGLVFGLYPARQASQKSPIEALRYE